MPLSFRPQICMEYGLDLLVDSLLQNKEEGRLNPLDLRLHRCGVADDCFWDDCHRNNSRILNGYLSGYEVPRRLDNPYIAVLAELHARNIY